MGLLAAFPASAADPIKIGLMTALSGQSARAGEALTRGLTIAIDEVNAKGGVLGRKVELVRRDDEANPAKGVIAARELVQREKVAVLIGELDTPVALAIVPFANKQKVPFIDPWAAGTGITVNGAKDNYVFRVSARDDLVDKAIVNYAIKNHSVKKPGLILVNNPWGKSNERGLTAALEGGEHPAGRHREVRRQRCRCRSAAGAPEAGRGGCALPRRQYRPLGAGREVARPHGLEGADRLPLGTGRRSLHRARGPESRDVVFIQTYSFFGKLSPVGERVMTALKAKYPDVKGPGDVTPAVGVANAYDALHLAALAIEKAGSTKGEAIRDAMYKIERHEGLIKTYDKPFSPANHEAVGENDYIWTRFEDNQILPVLTN